MPNSNLIPVESVNSIELFTDGGLDKLLAKIEKEVTALVPDLKTASGRKEIASNARKVAKSKIVIDNAGKELVADWKSKAKVVDESRRHARTFLDDLRDRVRQPLTDYEADQLRIAELARKLAELETMQAEANAENEIWDREQAIKLREAELAYQEEERQREEAERREADERAQRDAQWKEQVEEQARLDAEEKIRIERERAEQAERERVEANADAVRERAELAKQVERDRVAAEVFAERERQEAVEQERRRMESIVAAEKREAAARTANKENRRKVNTAIVAAFQSEGIGEKTAKKVVTLVASGSIPNMTIRY